MDWNNHPDTNFDQVILVLEKAIQIIGDKIETTTR
jgi:hypothetical protein